jgi:hypothetical protein
MCNMALDYVFNKKYNYLSNFKNYVQRIICGIKGGKNV